MEPRRSGSGIPKFSHFLNGNGDSAKASTKTPLEINDQLQRLIEKTAETLEQNSQLERENVNLKVRIQNLEDQVHFLQAQVTRMPTNKDNNNAATSELKYIIRDKDKKIDKLAEDVKNQKHHFENIIRSNNQILNRLACVIPTMDDPTDNNKNNKGDVELTVKEIESKINQYFTNTDLKLYEANEKIIELQESKTILEDEVKVLKDDNARLSELGALVTNNMRETLDNNVIMGEKIIELRTIQKDLVQKSRDSIDSPKPFNINDEIHKLSIALSKSEDAYEIKLADMKRKMEETIEKETNDRTKLLQLRINILEKDLEAALARSDEADKEIDRLKRLSSSSTKSNNNLLNSNESEYDYHIRTNISLSKSTESLAPPIPPPQPPPPPPPLPNATLTLGNYSLKINSGGSLQKTNKHLPQQQVGQATAIDAIVSEIKNGRVTLRKRRPTKQQEKKNPLLSEMFDLLEKSRRQNRNSKIIIGNEINAFFIGGDNF